MTESVRDPTLGTTSTVGRYFGVVSAIPSLLLTVYTFLLLASGAWTEAPKLAKVGTTIRNLTAGDGIALALLALVVALALHGLQFGIVQILERYWGGSPVARYLRTRRILAHARRRSGAFDLYEDAASDQQAALHAASEMDEASEDDPDAEASGDADPGAGIEPEGPDSPMHAPTTDAAFDYATALTLAADALDMMNSYPDDVDSLMATRLGNVLRRYEDIAGRAYNLDILTVAPHLSLVAPASHVAYLQDQRSQLDLEARLCATGLIATVLTVVVMWPWGWWLAIAAAPYVVAYLTYRGAVSAARHYGIALLTVVDLNRFELYNAMHFPLPATNRAERHANRGLAKLLAGAPADVTYSRETHAPKTGG